MNPGPDFPLHRLYLYLTDGCNLCCRHCWIEPKHGSGSLKFLDPGLLSHIVRQALPLGLRAVKLTGGEPLLHPDIERILDHLGAQKLGVVVETNGTLCSPEIAGKLASVRAAVSVSLDGADAETHEWIRGIPGCFGDALTGIRHLTEHGIRPQIIMSLMRRNHDQIESMVHLAESLGASSVKFNLVQPTARGELLHKSGAALGVAELIKTGRWVEEELAGRTRIHLDYHYPPAFSSLKRFYAEGGGRCGLFGILGVLADGRYALCGIGQTIPELVFGRADRDELAAVWNTNAVLGRIRETIPGKLTGVCSTCLMRNRCMGSCIAQNYYRKKDLVASFWFCEEAAALGLFPASRSTAARVS